MLKLIPLISHRYVWRDVRVLDYDPKRKKFLIQLGQNGMMKYVGRLSLLFHDEDPEKFKQRLQEARERQEIAEDEMRFYHYVDSQPDQTVSTLNHEVIYSQSY